MPVRRATRIVGAPAAPLDEHVLIPPQSYAPWLGACANAARCALRLSPDAPRLDRAHHIIPRQGVQGHYNGGAAGARRR
jgi:hypothetical protein